MVGVEGRLSWGDIAATPAATLRCPLLEVHDECQVSQRRYLSECSMAKLYESDNDGADTKEVGTKTKELLAG